MGLQCAERRRTHRSIHGLSARWQIKRCGYYVRAPGRKQASAPFTRNESCTGSLQVVAREGRAMPATDIRRDRPDEHGHQHQGEHPHAGRGDDHVGGPGHDHGHDDHAADHAHAHHGGPLGWLAELFGGHSHGAPVADAALEGSDEGIRAVKISLVALFLTAALQAIVVMMSGSVVLMCGVPAGGQAWPLLM